MSVLSRVLAITAVGVLAAVAANAGTGVFDNFDDRPVAPIELDSPPAETMASTATTVPVDPTTTSTSVVAVALPATGSTVTSAAEPPVVEPLPPTQSIPTSAPQTIESLPDPEPEPEDDPEPDLGGTGTVDDGDGDGDDGSGDDGSGDG